MRAICRSHTRSVTVSPHKLPARCIQRLGTSWFRRGKLVALLSGIDLSTDHQGRSVWGLTISARPLCAPQWWEFEDRPEFTEIEDGRRPERRRRLTRSVAFLNRLLVPNVDVRFADLPLNLTRVINIVGTRPLITARSLKGSQTASLEWPFPFSASSLFLGLLRLSAYRIRRP